ncbi:protein of unknown function [Methanoculleus bourgensis]|uniref:Uncharacterized protein n=1 Tax=Methanoculleus bourgensis TaxID=83986 RepID=A0A0X3BM92_9EURY|nr:protein of unknown function [Methanoculleus bourgensis]
MISNILHLIGAITYHDIQVKNRRIEKITAREIFPKTIGPSGI